MCIITHDIIINMMLEDINRMYGKEAWRIVRNNVQFKSKGYYIQHGDSQEL